MQWSSDNQGGLCNTTKSLQGEDLLRMKSWQTPRQAVIEENGIHDIVPIRSTQFLEQKKWPPFIPNQWEEKRADFCSAKNSHFWLQQNLGQPYSKWKYCRNNNALEQNLVTPFTFEVIHKSISSLLPQLLKLDYFNFIKGVARSPIKKYDPFNSFD